jgi:hypothetical protein
MQRVGGLKAPEKSVGYCRTGVKTVAASGSVQPLTRDRLESL